MRTLTLCIIELKATHKFRSQFNTTLAHNNKAWLVIVIACRYATVTNAQV